MSVVTLKWILKAIIWVGKVDKNEDKELYSLDTQI